MTLKNRKVYAKEHFRCCGLQNILYKGGGRFDERGHTEYKASEQNL